MKAPFSLIVAFVLFVFSLSVHGKVIYVNGAMPAGGDGASWPTACRYLQDALAQTVAGDEVWVAAGTYYPDDGALATAGDRTATFSLKQDVKLYGGFAGMESATAQRNLATSVTTLSGEIWAEKIYWSLHVVTLAGGATLDGFTVTKGNANGEAAPYNQGGGVFVPIASSANSLANCTFSSNTAVLSGGAISTSSPLTATSCTFIGNSVSSTSAASGGAIYCLPSSPLITTNCTFTSNTASSSPTSDSSAYGGAINSGTLSATGCTFTDNTTSSSFEAAGGAIYCLISSSLTISNCIFTNNSALSSSSISSSYGGAIKAGALTAGNCTFIGNTASSYSTDSSAHGGAINSSTLTATECTFSNNATSAPYSASGGAINSGGLTATECTFTGNTASSPYSASGGAINSGGLTATG